MLIRILSFIFLFSLLSCSRKEYVTEDQQAQLILEFASLLEKKELNYKHKYENEEE